MRAPPRHSHGDPTSLAAPVCAFSRGTTARSVSLSWGAREVGSPYEWRGGARHCSRAMGGVLEWFAIFFSRGIFLTQGLNTHLLHWQVDSLLLGRQGSPILPGSLVLSLPQSNCILLGQLYHQPSPAGPQSLFIFHFLRLSFYFLVSHHSLQTYPV